VAIWEDVLELAPIGVTDNFFDLGVTSLASARLFRRLEEELGDRVPLGGVLQAPTVAELAQLIERGRAGARWTSLVPVRPLGTRPPLFCLHGGTGRILYAEWLARALGDDQPVYALQARGRFGSARPQETVEEMARHYLTEVRSVQPNGPYHFAGYCFGAVVAYEMMRQLAEEGEEVPVLIMLAGASPSWTRQWGWYGNQPSLRPLFEDAMARARRHARPRTVRGRLARALREPRRLPRPAIRAARRVGARFGLDPHRGLTERQRDAIFLDITTRATKAYDEGFHHGDALLIYPAGLYEDPHLGWDGHLLGEIEAHAIPGQHRRNADMLLEPHLTELCAHVKDYLRRRGGSAPAVAVAEAQAH
jgi:thioesterase domain-containing protein/acyl carrier protein